jgi:hypothetical protein
MKCAHAGCAKNAMKGSIKCYQHSPEAAEARKALAAKMVAARAAKRQQKQEQPSANVPDDPARQARCKLHGWIGGWWEDCPGCSGRATSTSNPDEVQTKDWVEKTRDQ